MRSLKNLAVALVVALIDKDGMVIEKPICCPECGEEVSIVSPEAVKCGKHGVFNKEKILSYFSIKDTAELVFTESN